MIVSCGYQHACKEAVRFILRDVLIKSRPDLPYRLCKPLSVFFPLNTKMGRLANSTDPTENFSGSNSYGLFTLPDNESFFDLYEPIYETSVVKFLNLRFHAVIFIFHL